MNNQHMIGFEKEILFQQARIECQTVHDNFKAKTLKTALQIIYPEFMENLFSTRPCVRKLKFIGHDNQGEDAPFDDFDPFFEYGKVYESIDFNGGTYRIKGYDGRIGAGYFEVCATKLSKNKP